MNFCQKSDLYISLYIDNKLEAKAEELFLKHIEECPECAQKLKEESLLSSLCMNDEPVALPQGFQSALRSRLLDTVQKEQKPMSSRLMLNKKYMAAVSSAAVVVISLLAYNLIPGSGVFDNRPASGSLNENSVSGAMVSGAESDTGIKYNRSIAGGEGDGNNYSSSKMQKTPEGGNVTDEQEAAGGGDNTASAAQKEASEDMMADRVTVYSGSASQAANTGNIKAKADRERELPEVPANGAAAQAGGSTASPENDRGQYQFKCEMSSAFSADTGAHYFTSYVELDLTFSPSDTGIKELDRLMGEKGAVRLGSGMVNGFEANTAGIAQYVDYSVPLSEYASLQSEALLKYKLELKAKTDIIKTDVTEEYNNLENEKIVIENKIKEALKNGQDISSLETEKSVLLKQMEAIIAKNGSMTVRIFLVNK
ncbi:hypothetical protein CLHUN_16130 [Ruminiclostridium hungatei]|uniref:Putative zinc-finger domain-containing protein n=1 Tax=Ruminiclostridium hungatei TaxID=48256 RepID=A0A1V4SL48_RUMHU|nr:anti-sigma factor [Ruminiclostridium hungatei]OPX44619.1 hypothetical protein CLHUN_16130 [Ruminiclostridium hungatei]